MSSRGDQSNPSATLQTPRATRISEAEWNVRHQRLEKLYLDDDLSRQEIIEIMAREDNFLVTEKQLKYRFKKWGLKKYVSDRDLTTMLSFKRKRQEQGKNTGFEYRGHLFEEERLERASKRRKEALMSSPVLPPHIVALVSPRPSPQMNSTLSGHYQTSATPGGVTEAMEDSGLLASLESLLDDSHHQSGHVSDLWENFDLFSYPARFYDSGQSQSNSGLRETLLDNNSVLPSPRHGSVLLSSLGQEFNATHTGLRRRMFSSTPDISAAQVGSENEVTSLDMDLDFDFSMFESPPHGPSAARSASFHVDRNPRISGEITSISPFQLADDNGTRSEDRNVKRVPGSTTAEGQALGRVTAQDVRAESIASLLMMLKSYVLPSFDIASQKYEYGNSVITKVLCPHLSEWLCSEYEELLDIYLERTLMSNRKRRTARISGPLTLGSNVYIDEPEQDLELIPGIQQSSNTTEGIVAKLRSVFFHPYWTPVGKVLFEVKEGSSSLAEEEQSHPDLQITITFMPRAMERTLGLCARIDKLRNKPGISPHINTFNVIPDNSAIFECISRNHLQGVQTLFGQGAASARDVDSRGRSLLNYAIYTGCSDLFRLLIHGGASFYALDIHNERTTDIITTIWTLFELPKSRDTSSNIKHPPISGDGKFDECVAMTQLALDNDCNIYDANDRGLASGPLFRMIDYEYINGLDSSDLRDMILYLTSIGYNLEERNSLGQTPLLDAASQCLPATEIHLRLLIERGARLDAKDDFGLGLLHTVLLCYFYLIDWENEMYPYDGYEAFEYAYGYAYPSYLSWVPDERDLYWGMSHILRDHAEDYRHGESVEDPLTSPRSTSTCQSTPASSVAGPDAEKSCLVDLQGSQVAIEQSIPTMASNSELESDTAFSAEEFILELDDVEDFVVARDDEDGKEYWIRNPVPILKARVATKLKILLEAGCDPNVLDDDGLSPSDYAESGLWSREGFWSQWSWALRMTGYTFDEEQNRWIKRSTPA